MKDYYSFLVIAEYILRLEPYVTHTLAETVLKKLLRVLCEEK